MQVNWLEEEPCFYDIATQLSSMYASQPSCVTEAHGATSDQYTFMIQHVLFPAFKQMLIPSTNMGSDGSFVEVRRDQAYS